MDRTQIKQQLAEDIRRQRDFGEVSWGPDDADAAWDRGMKDRFTPKKSLKQKIAAWWDEEDFGYRLSVLRYLVKGRPWSQEQREQFLVQADHNYLELSPQVSDLVAEYYHKKAKNNWA